MPTSRAERNGAGDMSTDIGALMNKTAGAVLIFVGLVVMVWGFFGFKTRDKVLDVGPIHATKETTHHVPYAPIAGALVIVGGVVLMASGRGS